MHVQCGSACTCCVYTLYVRTVTKCSHSHHMYALPPHVRTATTCTHCHHMYALLPHVLTATTCTPSHHMYALPPHVCTAITCTHRHHMYALPPHVRSPSLGTVSAPLVNTPLVQSLLLCSNTRPTGTRNITSDVNLHRTYLTCGFFMVQPILNKNVRNIYI